jgi:hypothetical protein
MSQPSFQSQSHLSGVGAMMDPGYLRNALSNSDSRGADFSDETSLRGESWLIGGTAVICFYLALLACFA